MARSILVIYSPASYWDLLNESSSLCNSISTGLQPFASAFPASPLISVNALKCKISQSSKQGLLSAMQYPFCFARCVNLSSSSFGRLSWSITAQYSVVSCRKFGSLLSLSSRFNTDVRDDFVPFLNTFTDTSRCFCFSASKYFGSVSLPSTAMTTRLRLSMRLLLF